MNTLTTSHSMLSKNRIIMLMRLQQLNEHRKRNFIKNLAKKVCALQTLVFKLLQNNTRLHLTINENNSINLIVNINSSGVISSHLRYLNRPLAVRRYSSEQVFLKITQHSQENTCVWSNLQLYGLQQKCFLVNIAKD